MERRSFLRVLGLGATAIAAGLALDPERLLWVPGAKTFFLPSPATQKLVTSVGLTTGDLFTIDGVFSVNPLSGAATGYLQRFVVTADVHSGAVPMDIVYPPLIEQGPFRTIHRSRKDSTMRVQPYLTSPQAGIPVDVSWEAPANG